MKSTTLLTLGILFCICVFSQDKLVADTSKTFSYTEKMASFPGGQEGWRRYLMHNLNAETPVNHGAPAGKYTVIVQFKVCTDGSLCDIEAKNNPGFGLSEEAIRVIQKSGIWVPAEQNGRKVKSIYRQPISFMVEETKEDSPGNKRNN